MLSQYYLVRAKADGRYLVANLNNQSVAINAACTLATTSASYLLMFREHFDALSYLNTHASDIAQHFAVESIPGTQVANLLQRWGFTGVGIVQDPLLPKIEFLSQN